MTLAHRNEKICWPQDMIFCNHMRITTQIKKKDPGEYFKMKREEDDIQSPDFQREAPTACPRST